MLACMVALQIRNVPDSVRDTLTARAKARGQSLQRFLLAMVVREAENSPNIGVLDAMDAWTYTDSPAVLDDVLAAIDAGRTTRLADAGGRAR